MRIALLALGLLVVGCSDPPPSTDGVGERIAPPPRPRRERPEPLYDGNGVPRESDVTVAGLVLPRGLTAVEGTGSARRHHFTSEAPPGPLLRYFGPRLTTLDVREEGSRTTYYDAVPRGVRGGVVRLDVTIAESSGHAARVTVYERPPPRPEGTKISADEIRRHLEAEANRPRE